MGTPEEGVMIEITSDCENIWFKSAYSTGERSSKSGNLRFGFSKYNDGYVPGINYTKYWRYPGETDWRR